ncbi:MAG: single-stranded-DNA-specific exonuclease RecJ [Thermodesulfobacteriota bacterium]
MQTPKTAWIVSPPSPKASILAGEAGISLLQARLLLNRGITTAEAATGFLSPSLSGLTHPGMFKDMGAAVDRVIWAARRGRPITVYGDYDADGITSTALLVRFFKDLAVSVSSYIPDRFDEGYGLNRRAVQAIAGSRRGLLVTVDCGTNDREEVELAMSSGLEVVITDHHRADENFQPLCPVLNPKRPDCTFPFRGLAGVGVAFFLAVAVRAALRKAGWFRFRGEPDLREYLDLVALGTVADMVPLLDENRRLVTAGMKAMATSTWPGLLALQERAGIKPDRVSVEDVAFRLAPRINAAGRLGKARIGLETLLTSDPTEARDLAERLQFMNDRRQELEKRVLGQIESELPDPAVPEGRRTLVIQGNGWHQGVLGIVASRIAALHHRPVLVLDVRDGLASGSGRSIEGFDLHRALQRLEPLFTRFGGHRQAVGLSLETRHLDRLRDGLEAVAQEELTESDLHPVLHVEAELPPGLVTRDLIDEIYCLGPFGSGNPEPRFLGTGLDVIESRVVGDRHLKLLVADEGREMEAIGFGQAGRHPLAGSRIDAVYHPRINRWKGMESVQLNIQALDPADE